jgi:hypothetical protein
MSLICIKNQNRLTGYVESGLGKVEKEVQKNISGR